MTSPVSQHVSTSATGSAMTMACATPSVADMATAISIKRATVRVNGSAMDVISATSKLMKKCPDEAPFPLLVKPYLPVLGRYPN